MATADVASASKGGFWIRFGAYLIDVVVFIVIAIVLSVIGLQNALQSGLGLVIGLAYFVYFWSGSGGGQTLGMRVLGLRVVKTDGSTLNYVGAFIRYIGLIIASIPIFIGLIWIAFDANKQGWHDKIAGTYVIKT